MIFRAAVQTGFQSNHLLPEGCAAVGSMTLLLYELLMFVMCFCGNGEAWDYTLTLEVELRWLKAAVTSIGAVLSPPPPFAS